MKIDLRSDTVTKPTRNMLEAMFSAEVGDDVFDEDPTIIALEAKASDLFGKEAALFCPSGTMTNQIAIKVHTQPGDEVICDETAHIYNYEGGGIAFNSGCSVRLLHGDRGRYTATDVVNNINPDNIHHPVTNLVVVENTSNRGGGSIWSLAEIARIHDVCRENGLKIHLDGARLFNALVETKGSTNDFGQLFDTVSICLSKGLGAPVGSLLIGSKDFIRQARRVRKVFGGGMRQAGYLAAAGIYALDHHIKRLKDDHSRARQIGEIMGKLPFVEEVLPIETNIVVFRLNDHMPSEAFIKTLAENDILVVAFGKQTVRMVTHLDFDDVQLEAFEGIVKRLFGGKN
nr:aminotransferase class I/II-fold pyridoxal phosphate-dependent enzyme [Bacteroidota bacterium]